eukprot:c14050_g1_i1.p1 GENE.c14050_g1_i1~~c14050_g1_i1.p1  ORF type:complete len:246 (-),score=33.43 c14050_g1_i1:52-789(-)
MGQPKLLDMSLPVCKFGTGCYRKNPAHLNAFSHPWFQSSPTPSPKAAASPPAKAKPAPAPTNAVSPSVPAPAPTKSKLPAFLASPAPQAPKQAASPQHSSPPTTPIPNPVSSRAPKRGHDSDDDNGPPPNPKRSKPSTAQDQEIVLMYTHDAPPLFCICKMLMSRWDALKQEVLSNKDNPILCDDYGISSAPGVTLSTTHEIVNSTQVLTDPKQLEAFSTLFGSRRFVGTSRRLLWHDIHPNNFP